MQDRIAARAYQLWEANEGQQGPTWRTGSRPSGSFALRADSKGQKTCPRRKSTRRNTRRRRPITRSLLAWMRLTDRHQKDRHQTADRRPGPSARYRPQVSDQAGLVFRDPLCLAYGSVRHPNMSRVSHNAEIKSREQAGLDPAGHFSATGRRCCETGFGKDLMIKSCFACWCSSLGWFMPCGSYLVRCALSPR